MILEIADIRIHPGQNAAFEAAIARGLREVVSHAHGMLDFQVHHGIENPQRYVLQIRWATLEDHTVGFRQSEAFSAWRAIVGPFFAEPPVVEHFAQTHQRALAFSAPAAPLIPITGSDQAFAVRRIYCVGRNYAAHAQEMGGTGREAPFFFMKPADAIVYVAPGSNTPLPYPSLTSNFHHEIELVAAIGRGGSNIPASKALEHVLGYAVGLDMTRRDLQSTMKKAGQPWSISKGFDHSAPIGPITRASDVPQIANAHITLQVNQQTRQHSDIGKLLWSVAETIEHLSQAWELQPGDLIFTGTPEGVAAVERGDVLEGSITGLEPIRLHVV